MTSTERCANYKYNPKGCVYFQICAKNADTFNNQHVCDDSVIYSVKKINISHNFLDKLCIRNVDFDLILDLFYRLVNKRQNK